MASNPKLTETLHRISDYLSSHETHIKALYDDDNNAPGKNLDTDKNASSHNINIRSPDETMLRKVEFDGNESFSLNIGGVDVRVYAKRDTMHVLFDGRERNINMENSILSQFKDNEPRGWGSNGGNNAGAISIQ